MPWFTEPPKKALGKGFERHCQQISIVWAGTAGSLNLRIWAGQGMQARATGPRHMAVRGSRFRYACRPMGNDPPESHHNQGHPDLHARSTVHMRRSEVASGGFTEPPTL